MRTNEALPSLPTGISQTLTGPSTDSVQCPAFSEATEARAGLDFQNPGPFRFSWVLGILHWGIGVSLRGMNGLYLFLGLLCLGLGWSACSDERSEDPRLWELPLLELRIKSEHWVLLQRKRQAALRAGLLVNKPGDYVPAELTYQDQQLQGLVRLKGDWLDHLKGKKWSLRVKLDSTQSLWGMQRFSIQHPRTRSYLDEWVWHQLLEEEDILCPRYRFVRVRLNGDYKGIFALEEHFDRLLLERQGRREGPILKYAEAGFWQMQEYDRIHGVDLGGYLPVFEAADIEVFQKGRTRRDSVLASLYQAGRQRMEAWRWSDPGYLGGLDTSAMARLLALADVAQAYHALRWHNLRLYHNPLSAQLEPVVYDAYGSNGPYRWFSKPYFGFYNDRYKWVYFREEMLLFQLFNQAGFRRAYYQHLQRFTQPAYLRDFLERHRSSITTFEKALQSEFPAYHYDWNFLSDQAADLARQLPEQLPEHPPFVNMIFGPSYDSCRATYPFPSVSLKSEYPSRTDRQQLRLSNYFCQALQLQATGPKKSKPLHRLYPPRTLPPYNAFQQPQVHLDLELPPGDRYVFFSIPGNDFWYRHKIDRKPIAFDAPFQPLPDSQLDSAHYVFREEAIVLPAGVHRIARLQILPPGRALWVEAGAKIDLVEGGGFLLRGNLRMEGEAGRAIYVGSSDGQSRGWQVIGAPEVLLRAVYFSKLEGLRERGFRHSGGLSFYRCRLRMEHCRFDDFTGEDALNIVSCPEAVLEDLEFSHCRGDALDVDFSKLSIRNARFVDIGGDALDASGSELEGENLVVEGVQDKGLSLGEASRVRLAQVAVRRARIGVAVKDATQATLRGLSVEATDYGVAVFNKKSSYAAARLDLSDYACGEEANCLALERGQHLWLDRVEQLATDSVGTLRRRFY